jgi:hypothetical protein
MSKQTGLIKLDGKIGGVSFYRSNGKDLAKLANGPKKEKILTDPSFARTRENLTEFGGSATGAKALRHALSSALMGMSDRYMSNRLLKVFKEINLKGTGSRGQRTIALSANRSLLNGFEFNQNVHFSSVFDAPFSSAINTSRTQATITVPAFLPSSFINVPEGATHFQLVAAIGVVSDYAYNPVSKHYEPTDPVLNMLNAGAAGAITALNVTTAVNFSLMAALTGTPTMTATVTDVVCFGIQFFQQIGSVNYLLAQNNCMAIVGLF